MYEKKFFQEQKKMSQLSAKVSSEAEDIYLTEVAFHLACPCPNHLIFFFYHLNFKNIIEIFF